MQNIEIYWDDLTDEAKERLHLLNHDNVDLSPIAIVNIEEEVVFEMFRELNPTEQDEFKQ